MKISHVFLHSDEVEWNVFTIFAVCAQVTKKSLIFIFISHKVATTTLPLHASHTLATFGNRCFVATTTPFFSNASVFTQIYKQYFDFN